MTVTPRDPRHSRLAVAAATPPTITSVDPATPARSERPQTLTVTGTDFKDGLKLIITGPNGEIRTLRRWRHPVGPGDVVPDVRDPGGGRIVRARRPESRRQQVRAVLHPGQGSRRRHTGGAQRDHSRRNHEGRTGQTITLTGSQFAPDASVIVTDPAGTVSTLRTFEKSTAQTIVVRLVLDQRGTYSIVRAERRRRAVQSGDAERELTDGCWAPVAPWHLPHSGGARRRAVCLPWTMNRAVASVSPSPDPEQDDELLDAYSRAVMRAVDAGRARRRQDRSRGEADPARASSSRPTA